MHGRIVRNEKCSEKRIDILLHMHGTSTENLGAGTVHVRFRSRCFFGVGGMQIPLWMGRASRVPAVRPHGRAGFLWNVGRPASPARQVLSGGLHVQCVVNFLQNGGRPAQRASSGLLGGRWCIRQTDCMPSGLSARNASLAQTQSLHGGRPCTGSAPCTAGGQAAFRWTASPAQTGLHGGRADSGWPGFTSCAGLSANWRQD